MEKLGQLRAEDRWDLIVVDTPPSRSALDFLDAPQAARLVPRRSLHPAADGPRAHRRPGLPQGARGRASARSPALLTKILGAQVLKDVQTFVAALDTMFGGFRERADATYRLLQAPGTAFVVVAAPERDALREASYFVERLAEEGMPLAGLVLNRVHGGGAAVAVGRAGAGRRRDPRRVGRAPAGGRAAAAARRAGAGPRAGAAAAQAVHGGAPAGAGGRRARAGRATCTTWPACARSAPPSPA